MSVRASILSAAVLCLTISAAAQYQTSPNSNRFGSALSIDEHSSSIIGHVQSIDGQSLADCKVELHELNGSVALTVYTDNQGSFVVQQVPNGTYEIVAQKDTSESLDRISVAGGQTMVTLRLPLQTRATDGSTSVSVAQFRVPEKARKIYGKAEEAMRKGKLDEAKKYAEQALTAYPQYADALTIRGILEMNSGAVEQAMADFDSAVKADPNYALAYTTMGAAYNQIGKYKEAERVLRRSMSIKPDSWQVYFELAKSMLGEGDYKQALQYVNKSGEISQEYAPVHLVKAHALLGVKDYQDAIGELELYLNREPTGTTADAARKTLTAAKAFAQTSQK